jgi:hypothetical protein
VAVKDVDSVGVEAASSVGAGSRRPGKRRRGHGWHSCGLDEDFCTMVGHAGGDRDFFWPVDGQTTRVQYTLMDGIDSKRQKSISYHTPCMTSLSSYIMVM